jgi:predicted TIM-barrel fold metal-dependent hydrolase
MRTVALEEHFNIPSLVSRIPKELIHARGFPPPEKQPGGMMMAHGKLQDLGDGRIADMDAAGVTLQVLSVSGPGADLLPASESVPWAKEANDVLAQAVGKHPKRFAGFAHLPMTAPDAAAEELTRCVRSLGFVGALVNGLTQEKFLDDPMFEPVLSQAEQLDVPIYIHPNIPPEAVRNAYYSNLPEPMGFMLSIAGFGWHAETAIHVLRLILSGRLDRHPKLKIIIGHMGEFLPLTLARTDAVFRAETSKYLKRSVAQTLREQVYVTTSGQFTYPPLMALLATFGIEHVLFSIDYPYSPNDRGRTFLDNMPLAPADVKKIAHENADILLKLQK